MGSAVEIPLYSAPRNVLKAILGENNMLLIQTGSKSSKDVTVMHDSNIYKFPILQTTECTKARLHQYTLRKIRASCLAAKRRGS
jgi:hypothetical protein